MSRFVESLKRLYGAGKISDEKLSEMLTDSKISQEDYDYIIK